MFFWRLSDKPLHRRNDDRLEILATLVAILHYYGHRSNDWSSSAAISEASRRCIPMIRATLWNFLLCLSYHSIDFRRNTEALALKWRLGFGTRWFWISLMSNVSGSLRNGVGIR